MTVAAFVNRFVGNSCNLFCVITSVIVWWPLSTDSLLRDHICHCVVAVVNRFMANTINVWSHWHISLCGGCCQQVHCCAGHICYCVVAVVNRLSLCGGCCQQIVIVWWLCQQVHCCAGHICYCVVAVVNRLSLCGGCCQQIVIVWWLLSTGSLLCRSHLLLCGGCCQQVHCCGVASVIVWWLLSTDSWQTAAAVAAWSHLQGNEPPGGSPHELHSPCTGRWLARSAQHCCPSFWWNQDSKTVSFYPSLTVPSGRHCL